MDVFLFITAGSFASSNNGFKYGNMKDLERIKVNEVNVLLPDFTLYRFPKFGR
jgi:hypothetical protein